MSKYCVVGCYGWKKITCTYSECFSKPNLAFPLRDEEEGEYHMEAFLKEVEVVVWI